MESLAESPIELKRQAIMSSHMSKHIEFPSQTLIALIQGRNSAHEGRERD